MIIKVKDKMKIEGSVQVYQFPAELVPTYEDYLKLKNKEQYLVGQKHNTVTAIGIALCPIVMRGGVNTITHCAVGTGSPSSTALGTEVGTRIAITRQFSIGDDYHIDTFYGKDDPNSSSNVLTEAGLFSQLAAGGDMYSSNTISFTKDTTVTMVVAWKWTFS